MLQNKSKWQSNATWTRQAYCAYSTSKDSEQAHGFKYTCANLLIEIGNLRRNDTCKFADWDWKSSQQNIWTLRLLLCTLHTLSASAASFFFTVAVICLIRGVTCVLTPLLQLILHIIDWAHVDLHQIDKFECSAPQIQCKPPKNTQVITSQLQTQASTEVNSTEIMTLVSQRTP